VERRCRCIPPVRHRFATFPREPTRSRGRADRGARVKADGSMLDGHGQGGSASTYARKGERPNADATIALVLYPRISFFHDTGVYEV
jgi:hypothetical protein